MSVPDFLLQGAKLVILLLLSLSVHEFAHAWSAWKLGDDTAERMGRLTLNPFAHADLLGTFLLPLLQIPFGWARPVPVDPARFRRGVNMRTGMALTAAAGPIANVLLATVAAVVFGVLARFAPATLEDGKGVVELLVGDRVHTVGLLQINVSLALFNLIPIPPLDGARVVDGFVPARLRPAWEGVASLAPFLLLAVFFFGGRIIAGPAQVLVGLLAQLIQLIA